MTRLLPHPLLTPLLTLVWLLLANSLDPGHILLGLVLGWLIPLFTLRFWPDPVRIHRPAVLLRFLLTVLLDMLLANVTVARLILSRPAKLEPAFVSMPLMLQSDLAISLLANTISLTPGTVSARLSADRKHLLVHALHVTDQDALIQTIRQRYEQPLREVFEAC